MEKVKVTREETSLPSPSVLPFWVCFFIFLCCCFFFLKFLSSPLLEHFQNIFLRWILWSFLAFSLPGCNMSASFFCEGVGKPLNFVSVILSLSQIFKSPLRSDWERVCHFLFICCFCFFTVKHLTYEVFTKSESHWQAQRKCCIVRVSGLISQIPLIEIWPNLAEWCTKRFSCCSQNCTHWPINDFWRITCL